MARILLPILVAASAFLLVSCDTVDPDVLEPEYLVESYQVALEPIKPVRLSLTAGIGETYDFSKLAVSGANVQILLLDAQSGIEKTYTLRESRDEKGVYQATSSDVVLPTRTYRLEITFPDNPDRVTAMTTVPDTFQVVQMKSDTIVYQGDEQLELRLTRSSYPGRQTIFIFTTESLEPSSGTLTPFARRLYDDGEVGIEDLRKSTAPPLNEANYEVNPDGTLTVWMPWLMISFYGRHVSTANAIDDNLYDFTRSWQVQQGGSTLAPGEIPNIIDHVEGGTGLFASYASASVTFVVLENEEL